MAIGKDGIHLGLRKHFTKEILSGSPVMPTKRSLACGADDFAQRGDRLPETICASEANSMS